MKIVAAQHVAEVSGCFQSTCQFGPPGPDGQ
jgi:hypothetical protein